MSRPSPVNTNTMAKLASWITQCSFALLASRCLVCGERGSATRDLCPACAAALPWNRRACDRCGLPLPGSDALCGACLLTPPPFAQTRAAFIYAAPVDRLLPRFKFHGDLAAGALLAELMASRLLDAERPQALVPVPLHRQRLRQRGYDQALELAKGLAAALDLPIIGDVLRRVGATAAQSELDASARQRNVRGAFTCRRDALPAHVALVDDVMTTGATVRECALTLRCAGVARVDVWAVARAPQERS